MVAVLDGYDDELAKILLQSFLFDPDSHLLSAVIVTPEYLECQNLVPLLFDPGCVDKGTID